MYSGSFFMPAMDGLPGGDMQTATFAMILTKIHMENKKICGRIETELRSNILV